ncbi:MAG: signal peptidase I [Polyangiales bacterium]
MSDPETSRPETPATEGAPATAPTVAREESSPIARVAFYVGWFVVAPLFIAQGRALLLEALPASAFVEMLRGQPIPFAIVLFTIAEMILWSLRWSLPGASEIGVGGRAGLPPEVRRRFELARALRDEARSIQSAHAKEIARTFRAEQRAEIDAALTELDASLDAPSFDEPRFDSAFESASRIVDERLGRWRKGELREIFESVAIAIFVAVGIRVFVFEAFKIPSGSMIPTLLVGDHIFVNKLIYGPQLPFTDRRIGASMPPSRADVIVFQFPEKLDDDFIKRVIALPGDKLEVKSSRVYLNDKPIERCRVGRTSYVDVPEVTPPPGTTLLSKDGDLFVEYLDGRMYFVFYDVDHGSRANAGPWFPKPGEVYVLGDNRNNSRDSREWWGQKGGGVPFPLIKGRALGIWWSTSVDEGFKGDRFGMSVMGKPHLPKSMSALQPALDRCLGPNPPLDREGLPANAAP